MATFAYVGCRTTKERNARGKGIRVFKVDEKGNYELIQTLETLPNPSYLCMDRSGKFLYSVHGDFSDISSYAIDKENGTLTFLNAVSTGGTNPVHLSVDKSNRFIYVANLQTGTVAVLPRSENGTLKQLTKLYSIPGNEEGSISHPHQVAQDISGDYLVVSCQGRKQGFGQVDVFRIEHEGTLVKTCTVRSREIAEPRHVTFHPNNVWCYGVNEKDYSVTFYKFDLSEGILIPQQILPTLPDTYTGDGWASGIIMSRSGKYVVVSNRKHDSMTSFRIDQGTGMLKFCNCIKTGGGQPRFITLDGAGDKILAANETTDTITEFEIDEESGRFVATGRVIETESPVCAIFG